MGMNVLCPIMALESAVAPSGLIRKHLRLSPLAPALLHIQTAVPGSSPPVTWQRNTCCDASIPASHSPFTLLLLLSCLCHTLIIIRHSTLSIMPGISATTLLLLVIIHHLLVVVLPSLISCPVPWSTRCTETAGKRLHSTKWLTAPALAWPTIGPQSPKSFFTQANTYRCLRLVLLGQTFPFPSHSYWAWGLNRTHPT